MTYSFLGAGQMGSAIFTGLLARGGVAPGDVTIFEARTKRAAECAERYGVRVAASAAEAVASADLVVFAVKPQDLGNLLATLDPALLARPLFLSIAAGKPLAWLEERLPGARVVRAMPNLAMRVGEGMSALCRGSRATDADVDAAAFVLGCSGKVRTLPESLFDAVTALSGSGPAFFAVVLQAFVKGAVALGMPEDAAQALALQTLVGTGRVLAEGTDSPEAFVKAVTSAKGTTEAGLNVMKASDLEAIAADTLAAAARRSAELQKA